MKWFGCFLFNSTVRFDVHLKTILIYTVALLGEFGYDSQTSCQIRHEDLEIVSELYYLITIKIFGGSLKRHAISRAYQQVSDSTMIEYGESFSSSVFWVFFAN
jgi:hypothetical protein